MELCMEEIDIPLAFILISLPFIGIGSGKLHEIEGNNRINVESQIF